MAAEALLSSLLGLLFLGLLLPAHLTGGVGSLNLEELSEMRYGIQILPLPVMGGQVRGVGRGEGPVHEEGAHGGGGRAAVRPARETGGMETRWWCPYDPAENGDRPIPRDQAPAGVGLPTVDLGSPGPGESTRTPQGGEARAPSPPLSRLCRGSWRTCGLFSLPLGTSPGSEEGSRCSWSQPLPPCPPSRPFFPRVKLQTWWLCLQSTNSAMSAAYQLELFTSSVKGRRRRLLTRGPGSLNC